MKVAIIGAGNIAEKHLEVLAQFADVELAAICSRGNPRVNDLAARFGIERKFTDLREMLDIVTPDAVLVLVSATQIVAVGTECLRRGIPTLLEKPPGLSAAETKSLAAIAATNNCINMVALNRRFYSVMQSAREIILEAGPLVSVLVEGPERLAEVKAVGIHPPEIIKGLLFANGIHCIDLLRFFGGDVAEIFALSKRWNEDQNNAFGALISFAAGGTGHYISNWMAPGSWSVTLYGIGRRVVLNPLERGTLIEADRTQRDIPSSDVDQTFKPGLFAQNRFFFDCVQAGRQVFYPASDLADAVKTMELIEAIKGVDE